MPVNSDLTNTVPLSDVLVSLFNKRTLKIYPVVNPKALILEEINPFVEGRIILGVPSRIKVAKRSP